MKVDHNGKRCASDDGGEDVERRNKRFADDQSTYAPTAAVPTRERASFNAMMTDQTS